MKSLVKLIPFLAFISIVNANPMYGDQNCNDQTLFPTVPQHCNCLMNNAVNDCLNNSPIKSMCNIPSLSNLFKTNPNLANAECQKYGGSPEQCTSSITFYDQNC
jgi:hypothetical protein